MHRHTILTGVVGSTAYGLAGPESDVDRAGIFAYATEDLLGLAKPVESVVTKDPDLTLHEAHKALRLILGGNPTASEVLWLESYEVCTPLGQELIALRGAFLSAPRVSSAYLGYAAQQFRKLLARGTFGSDIPLRRTAKHARHLMRLVEQGYELYTTGHLRIRLENPQLCLEFGERVAADPQAAVPFMAVAQERFDAARTVLPDQPQVSVVDDWLRRVRAHYYDRVAER